MDNLKEKVTEHKMRRYWGAIIPYLDETAHCGREWIGYKRDGVKNKRCIKDSVRYKKKPNRAPSKV